MGSSAAAAGMDVRGLLGIGFWVRGFRSFPWMAVNYVLKDDLGVSSATYQLIKNSVDLPMVVKPVYGVFSDAVYIGGGHRLPYIAIGAALQATSWFLIALLPKSFLTVSTLFSLLLVSKLGASIAEVASDAIVAEVGKQTRSLVRLRSFVSMFESFGGILAHLTAGASVKQFPLQLIFILFALVLTFQFLITINISEQSLNLSQKKMNPSVGASLAQRRLRQRQFILSTDVNDPSFAQSPQRGSPSRFSSITQQFHELSHVLQRPDIFYSLCWLAGSYAAVPILTDTMFFYHTETLNLDASTLSLSRLFGQGYVFAWSVAYNKWLNRVPPRRLISMLQVVTGLIMVSDILFVKGVYRGIGISDSTYVIIFSGLLRELLHFKMLPFNILMAQLCPIGCEGSLMAFVTSAIALANIISGYFGVALNAFVGNSRDECSGLTYVILIQATCTILPLYWSYWIF